MVRIFGHLTSRRVGRKWAVRSRSGWTCSGMRSMLGTRSSQAEQSKGNVHGWSDRWNRAEPQHQAADLQDDRFWTSRNETGPTVTLWGNHKSILSRLQTSLSPTTPPCTLSFELTRPRVVSPRMIPVAPRLAAYFPRPLRGGLGSRSTWKLMISATHFFLGSWT
jgi:hypothetical protein